MPGLEHELAIVVAVITIVGAIIKATLSISGKISKSVDDLGEKVEAQIDKVTDAFHAHELQDQERHEQNLERFADLNLKIARRNGELPHR